MSAVDLSEFEAASRPQKKDCPVGLIRPALSEEEWQQLEAAIAKGVGQITNTAIVEWLRKRGHDIVNTNSVTAHREGKCTCGRA